MDKQYHFLKKPYLPPRLTSVSFMVERGFDYSTRTFVLPLFDNGGRGVDPYGTATNSGSFWDRDVNSMGGSDAYDVNDGSTFWN